MILSTFTRAEVLHALQKAASAFEERARNYCYYNEKTFTIQLKRRKRIEKIFSCELDGQRYFEKIIYMIDKGQISIVSQSVVTVFHDPKGVFVLVHSPNNKISTDYYIRTSLELRVFSGHFINRFVERTGKGDNDMSLIDKTMIILSQMQSIVCSSVEDEVIRRFGEPSLPFTFLQEGEKEVECSYLNEGDIAIVERYGAVPVWRTYISKEMLFEQQVDFINKAEVQERIQWANNISQRLNNNQ